jgi:hypothetical protein
MFMRQFIINIPARMPYSYMIHLFNMVSITNADLMTSVDHLQNLAVLKMYIFQGITTLGKASYLNYCECASPSGCQCAIRNAVYGTMSIFAPWKAFGGCHSKPVLIKCFCLCSVFSLVYIQLLCHPLRLTVKVTFLKTRVLRVLLKKKRKK